MSRQRSIGFGLALLVAISIQFVGRPASAAKALVNIVYWQAIGPAGQTFYAYSGTGTATVGTGPTPSVMWPYGLVSIQTSLTYSGQFTPSLYQILNHKNAAATIAKSHGNAATAMQTVTTVGITTTMALPFSTSMGATAYTAMCNAGSGMVDTNLLPPPGPTVACCTGARAPSCTAMGSTFMAAANSGATTHCFTLNPYSTATGGWPGSCTPRKGTMQRTPGLKKYGGTARFLRNELQWGTWNLGGPSKSITVRFGSYLPGGTPPSHASPPAVGRVIHAGTGHYTITGGGTTSDADIQFTTMPFTTGMASVINPLAYLTAARSTGSNNLDPTNLTGTISLVRPALLNAYDRSGPLLNGIGTAWGQIDHVQLTFLPEPSMALMLACGGLALAGLSRLRKR
jgi:hypothetical protein